MNETCLRCDEPITETEKKVGQKTTLLTENGGERRWFHRECYLRSVLGSVSHQQGKCSCFGGTDDHLDPPDMTKRQAAVEACRLYEKKNNVLLKESLNDEDESQHRSFGLD